LGNTVLECIEFYRIDTDLLLKIIIQRKNRTNFFFGSKKRKKVFLVFFRSYITFILRIPIFADKLECLLHIEKIIDNKMTWLRSKKRINSSLAKKTSFIGSATGPHNSANVRIEQMEGLKKAKFIQYTKY